MRTEEWMKCGPWTARGIPCPWQDQRDDDDEPPEVCEDCWEVPIPGKKRKKHTRIQIKMEAQVADAIKEAEYRLGLAYGGQPVVDALVKTAIIVAAAALLAKGFPLNPGAARRLNQAAAGHFRYVTQTPGTRGKGGGFLMHKNWSLYIKEITNMGGARKMGVARLSPQALYASGMGGPLAVEL